MKDGPKITIILCMLALLPATGTSGYGELLNASFLGAITHAGEDTLDLGEVTRGLLLVNQTLRQVKIPEKTGLIVITVRHPDDKLRFNPSSAEKIRSETSMNVLGKQEEIISLRKMALLKGQCYLRTLRMQ